MLTVNIKLMLRTVQMCKRQIHSYIVKHRYECFIIKQANKSILLRALLADRYCESESQLHINTSDRCVAVISGNFAAGFSTNHG